MQLLYRDTVDNDVDGLPTKTPGTAHIKVQGQGGGGYTSRSSIWTEREFSFLQGNDFLGYIKKKGCFLGYIKKKGWYFWRSENI